MYTSLVFLVVLGMWAAYLVQHSMRRREHLLTARSVDAFTEALRVLERRPSTPTTMPRSYAASPLQATAPTGSTATTTTSRDAAPVARPTVSARLRAAGLVGALVLFLAAVVATLAGGASPLLALAASALLVADVAYLRWSAAVARAQRLATRPAARPATRRAAEAVAAPVAPVEVAPAPAVVEVAPRTSAPALFDVRVFDEPAAEPAAEEPPAPGTWRPMPVPAPLYTRKPTAPAPAPAPVLEPVVVDEVDELVDLPSPFRKVANG